MGVTIDSLQIEIQSSSTDAAKGIDALAKSLEALKKNGAFKAVSTNLNNLSTALNNLPNVHQASNSLRTLANSIEKLKEVGSVASLANSLKKLPEALKAVAHIDLDKTKAQLEGVARAVSPLSAIKSGGLGTMVNAMKNLGKVTESLDDETISRFAEKVALLDAKLAPLSAKMSSIKAGFSAINSNARSAASGVQKFSEDIDTSALNLSSFIEIARAAVDTMRNLVQQFTEFIAQAIEWDGIAARFGRGFASEASETYAWIQRLNEEMGINIQEFMKYSSVYSTMLTGFGVAAEDAGKMALGYMELTYDIWAGYNDIYGSLEETAEAVKSAIAGEVEPIRRAGFTIVEATLKQTAANHGLEISIANATEAQKSYLRYLTLIDQAYDQSLVGTYAKEMNTAEGLMRTLAQQIKSLSQAFGSLFLPILVEIIPYIQAFVELLTEGVHAIAAMFGITIQGVDWSGYDSGADAIDNVTNSASGATGALDEATKAAKELKNATLGIDELNVISPQSATGGGSGGSGGGGGIGGGFDDLDIDSLWDESIFKDISSQIDNLKEKLKSWLPVLTAIGGLFASWGLLSLIESAGEAMVKLSEMEGKIGALKKALAAITILTIEAVLVFALSDEYLETGNLMALLGEALATAAGGFLMYKGFGTKGLVMSLAVSMIAQLAAITMNLADGGVEIDDPQLWIQSAFTTAIGGTAGGILAYKGLIPMSKGKGIGLGLLVGMSLSLAAITIGEVTANGEATTASIFTGLGSVLAAAGFGFTVGGPWGALIGAAVGLTVNIVGAVIGVVSKDAEKSLKEDMESRFGNITLDKESLEVYVENITAIPREVTIDTKVWNEELENYEMQTLTIPVNAALDIYTSESQIQDSLKKNVYKSLETLDAMNIKIAIGVDVDHSEYISQVEAFIQNAQEYLEQHYLTTSIAISILEHDSSNSLSNVLSNFYASNSGKLAELGAQLKDAVSGAFVDGEWIPDKLQEALELQQEIQDILDYVSEVEYRAKMQNLSLSVSGDALTVDSFEGVLEGATEAIESRLAALEEVKMSQLQVAIMEYDANIAKGVSEAEAKKIYDETVSDIEQAYQDGRVEVTYGTVDFGLETLKEAFADEIALAKSKGWFDYNEKLEITLNDVSLNVDIIDEGEGDRYTDIKQMARNIAQAYELELSALPDAARKNLEKLLEALEPTMADYERIAKANREAGTTVTSSVRDGLNDYNELKALSGDADAINYMIGQGFSTDTTFLNTLATAKNAGKQIDKSVAEGLLNNLTYVTDEATGLVTGIKNSVTGEVVAITPTLEENMSQLGVDMTTGLVNGAESEMKSSKKKWYEWAIWPWNWFKEKNEIHSPSKVFERGGNYIVEGLVNGIGVGALRDRLSEMWTNAQTWWDNNKDKLAPYAPSIGDIKDKLSSAWTAAKDWWDKSKGSLSTYTPSIGKIWENLKASWENAKTWWSKNRGSLSTYTPSIGKIWEKLKSSWEGAKTWWSKNRSNLSYTPSIGSISSKLSSAWTGAKNWWNKHRSSLSYTPSIGSIKDKVISAWNSAKKWWSSNAKLSTKLNISVPKLTVNWGEVSALGKTFKYPKSFSVKFAADGGIFKQGSLIWAGERGPEVMATAAGGRTGVMNVQQMQDAVYEGVFAAVSAAMRGNGGSEGSQAVNVYLDGKQITSAVEKRQRERGASIMGNEVYSY